MIYWKKLEPPFILKVVARYKIEQEDWQKVLAEARNIIQQEGKIRWLIIIEELKGWEESLKDWKFDLKYGKQFERIAFVGEGWMEEFFAKLTDVLIPGQARFFEHADQEKAYEWIKQYINCSCKLRKEEQCMR